MDDCDQKNNDEPPSEGETINNDARGIVDVGNVFSAIWLRCVVQTYNGYKRIVLDSRRCVLFNFRLFLVGVYITYEVFK